MKKRILQIIPTLDHTGVGKQMSLLSQGLPPEQFDVHVCTLSRDGPLSAELAEAGIPVAAIGRRWQLDPQTFWQLRCHVAQLRPHVIHSRLAPANAYGLAAAAACKVKHSVIGLDCIGQKKGWAELAIDRYLCRHCPMVVVASRFVRDSYIRHGLPSDKIRVISNGVAADASSNTTRGQLLAELGLPRQSRLIGLVGGLRPQKRVKDAIWAADLLKVIRNDVHLLVIGEGPHRHHLYRFREQVVIRDKVHFLGDRGDVSRIMPHFDVLWSTGTGSGQSNAVMEAMAVGVPVVAADTPGSRELVVPEKTGYLVAAGDRAGIARFTNKLLDDDALAKQLGRAGRERVQRNFSADKMIEQYAGLYQGLLE